MELDKHEFKQLMEEDRVEMGVQEPLDLDGVAFGSSGPTPRAMQIETEAPPILLWDLYM